MTILDDRAVPVALTQKGAAAPANRHLSYREARESPCMSCTSSPCCTHLILGDFRLDGLTEVDHALYLLNFEGILLSLAPDRRMDVYLYQPCGFLDVDSGLCTVHSTPLQPPVCVSYSGHSCGYRRRMTVDVDLERPLVDRRRMAWLAERSTFDDERRLVSTPAWDDILGAFAAMPLERRPAPPPPSDPVLHEWRSIALSEKPAERATRPLAHFGDARVSDPCHGCEAWCCKFLVFSRNVPTDASALEFLRYCLGFPAVEVGVADDRWALIVRTTCRHLDGNRCSVFGEEERPLQCGYYDGMRCGYRGRFGVARPDEIVRLRREQFAVLADSIVFDDLGRVVAVPPVALLNRRLEEAERAGAAARRP